MAGNWAKGQCATKRSQLSLSAPLLMAVVDGLKWGTGTMIEQQPRRQQR
jgi:hypothetical protein